MKESSDSLSDGLRAPLLAVTRVAGALTSPFCLAAPATRGLDVAGAAVVRLRCVDVAAVGSVASNVSLAYSTELLLTVSSLLSL